MVFLSRSVADMVSPPVRGAWIEMVMDIILPLAR